MNLISGLNRPPFSPPVLGELPESTFFKLYYEYTQNSEPPQNFHAWCAVGALSALLGKKCYIPHGHFTVFPNLYIVIIGDPGTRKSTSMNLAKKLVQSVKKVPLAPESATREAMIDDMSRNKVSWMLPDNTDVSYWQSSAFVGELEQFLGGKHINQQMVGFLTAIWDEPTFKERTRKGGEIVINNPFFSMVGCCTPAWFNTKMKQDVISDGFSRRTIFVLENDLHKMNPWPESSDRENVLRAELEKEALRIFNIGGQFTFDSEAREFWDHKYHTIREESKGFSDKVQHYFSSKHILAQKLSMCFSAALRNDRVVSRNILNLAFNFLGESEKSLDIVFSGVGRNELKAYSDRVYDTIQKAQNRGIRHQQLLHLYYDELSLPEFNEVLTNLVTQGLIETVIVEASSAPLYRAVQLKKRLASRNLLELASRAVP